MAEGKKTEDMFVGSYIWLVSLWAQIFVGFVFEPCVFRLSAFLLVISV